MPSPGMKRTMERRMAEAEGRAERARVLLVMGVSGSGTSTLGEALARALGADFIEGDAWHPPENVAKMARGEALTDADRWPWLRALRETLAGGAARRRSQVLACSALKEAYREALRDGLPGWRVVLLHGDRETLARRMAGRRDHFMPVALLDSQLADLEEPAEAIRVDIALPMEKAVEEVIRKLGPVPRPR